MSKLLSYADEQTKIRRYMVAPVWVPLAPTTQPLTQGPTLTMPHINLAHYPEHIDFPIIWRAIRDAVYQRRSFTWI